MVLTCAWWRADMPMHPDASCLPAGSECKMQNNLTDAKQILQAEDVAISSRSSSNRAEKAGKTTRPQAKSA